MGVRVGFPCWGAPDHEISSTPGRRQYTLFPCASPSFEPVYLWGGEDLQPLLPGRMVILVNVAAPRVLLPSGGSHGRGSG